MKKVKIGDTIKQVIKKDIGMAPQFGIMGEVIKVNRKTCVVKTMYGGWGGKQPIEQLHILNIDNIEVIEL